MNKRDIEQLLHDVKSGKVQVDDALLKIKDLPFEDLEFAKIDNHRELRLGYPEVIYAKSKTPKQVSLIVEKMLANGSNILATRASKKVFNAVKLVCENAIYNKVAKTITIKNHEVTIPDTYIAIVAAGTSDLPVVEEAYETALILGNKVKKIVDVGVAGLHRLLANLPIIQNAKVVIVIAGMEGALASVVGGLIDKPIIAVPTSIGYGANFHGLSALLSMLNSCASGVSVVNIDNGFGAAYNASIINHL